MNGSRPRGVVAGLCVLAAVLALVPPPSPADALEPGPTPVLEEVPAGWPRPIGLESAAYLLLDTDTGQVLAERDADERRPVASTVKVLTALTVVERTDLDEEVTVGDEVLDIPGSGVGLEPGDTWTVEELVDALIARSGNEAAEALAVHVGGSLEGFLRLMEQDAADLGVTGLELFSVSGLDDGNLLSARDLALIAAAALDHPELGPILGRDIVTLPGEGAVTSRNELLRSYPDATGVKTGFTSAAGNSLIGSAARDGRELVAVVLDAGDDPARFTSAGRLLDLGFDAYEVRSLGTSIRFAVAGGAVTLVVDDTELLLPSGQEAVLSPSVTARPPEGGGMVPVLVDGEELLRLPGELDRAEAPSPSRGGSEALGRAAVDGVYAVLRARAATQELAG